MLPHVVLPRLSVQLDEVLVGFYKALVVFLLLLSTKAIVWLVNMLLIAPRLDPLRHMPGPDGSAFQSHFQEIMEYVLLHPIQVSVTHE